MQVTRYGVQLTQLASKHLKMVRQWRNAEHVRPNMEFQEIISPNQQTQWFEQLDPTTNFYFIFQSGATPAGLIHIKNIDWQKQTGEAGIFTGNTAFLGTTLPMFAILALMDLGFYFLHLDTLQAKVDRDNKAALRFNQTLGYQKQPANTEQQFQYLQVDLSNYSKATTAFRKTAINIHGAQSVIEFDSQHDPHWQDRFQKLGTEHQEYLGL